MKNDVRNMFMTYYPYTLFPRRVLNRKRVCNRLSEHVPCMLKNTTDVKKNIILHQGVPTDNYGPGKRIHNRKPANRAND